MVIDKFTDKDKISPWAKESVEWAVTNGIMEGMGNGTLSPDTNLTREQMCVMLQRMYNMIYNSIKLEKANIKFENKR